MSKTFLVNKVFIESLKDEIFVGSIFNTNLFLKLKIRPRFLFKSFTNKDNKVMSMKYFSQSKLFLWWRASPVDEKMSLSSNSSVFITESTTHIRNILFLVKSIYCVLLLINLKLDTVKLLSVCTAAEPQLLDL